MVFVYEYTEYMVNEGQRRQALAGRLGILVMTKVAVSLVVVGGALARLAV